MPRSFLFLQGPQSYFFERVARLLIARGHRVHRVNLNFGDRLFWRLPAVNFRRRPEDWPAFVAELLEERCITDVLLHGDQRPYHLAAADQARARGVRVMVTDLGYVRPGWLTLEPDGMTSRSRFPRDPAAIRALAGQLPEPGASAFPAPKFHQLALYDIAYNAAAVFGRPLYPHYRHHGIHHPFAEYAGWVLNAPRRLAGRHATAAATAHLAATPGRYFLYPLQLATDFQLRAHSPFADARAALDSVLRSFSENAGERRLAVVAHPLDEGLINWRRMACGHGDGRVLFFEGGTPAALLANAAGVVTINSTVGLAALRHGVPVKPLGSAVYDVEGLTHSGGLAGFWRDPQPPDPQLLALFLRALIGTTQVEGGYHGHAAQACALPVFVERLENGPRIPAAAMPAMQYDPVSIDSSG